MRTLLNTYLNYEPEKKDILYHYCSVDALLNILSKKSLWLSDSSKTNDKQEIFWLLSNIVMIIDNTIEALIKEFIPELSDCSALLSLLLKEATSGYEKAENIKAKKFLTCFSEDRDLLSQWRAYGDDGNGVAIGVTSEYLFEYENRGMYDFTKVIYDPEVTTQFVQDIVKEQIKYILMNYSKDPQNKDQFKLDISLLLNSIYEEGYIFKNPAFHEEKEWRLIRKATTANWDDGDGVDDWGYSDMIEGFFIPNTHSLFSRSELKFRSTKNDIIPYIELGFEKITSKFIREIVLGPKCHINENDLLLLLNFYGYIEMVYDNSIKIVKSKCPYI